MVQNRVIPCLLLQGKSLIKTIQFNKFTYIGDPLNTCRIFNELEVDEMIILDIEAAKKRTVPKFDYLKLMASECFMPLAYGGGLHDLEDIAKIFTSGFEKVVINTGLFEKHGLLEKVTNIYGQQSVIAGVDIKKNIFNKYCIYSNGGKKKENIDLHKWIKELDSMGVGEIMVTNISNEGTWKGFDLDIIKEISSEIDTPLIVHGGAGTKNDIEQAVNYGGASAVAVGSMVVYQNKDMGVLINYPTGFKFEEENV